MLRIGLVGSQSYHALAFAQAVNMPDAPQSLKNVTVTAIYGTEKERTETVASKANIPVIVDKPEDLLEFVDAVMVVFRDGNDHFAPAKFFLEKGIPTWVDKPFTVKFKQAEELVKTAVKNNTLLAGGSNCKYNKDILFLKSQVKELQKNNDKIISANFNFPGELDSPYGGLYFYMGHSMEMLCTVFGSPISVKTDVHCGNAISIFKYSNFSVVVNFASPPEYMFQIYTPQRVINKSLDISDIHQEGVIKFVEAIRSNSPPEPYQSLLNSVKMLNVMEKSIISKNEVQFNL